MKTFKLKLPLIVLVAILITSQASAQSSFKFYDDISLPQTDAWNFVRQIPAELFFGQKIPA